MNSGKIIEKDELLALLPHREGMLLLSRILDYDLDAHTISAEYDITRDCLFYDPALGGIPAWISFECMAQSMAAIIGIENLSQGLGLILSVSNMIIYRPVLKAGSTLSINAVEDVRMDSVYTYMGEVSVEGNPAAKAKFTVQAANGRPASEREDYGSLFHHGPGSGPQ
ncbi:MAG: 3-hydroxylacyl-ACP dehydratase [Treponema sp.]|jgi:predicted hotdog family 3-hydroxylacyl-ACP dehydratase|nr:3-hydroxylacyl-ACP dehydratase [Treponema sp.]